MSEYTATDEGTEGRSSVSVRHYKMASISSDPELVTTYVTPYIHALAVLIGSGPCYIIWNDDGIDVFSMPSMAHVMAAAALEQAMQQEVDSGLHDDKMIAAILETATQTELSE